MDWNYEIALTEVDEILNFTDTELVNKIPVAFRKFIEKLRGLIIAAIPNVKKRFNTHEPTKFPIAKSVSFLIIAIIEVTSSGDAVPMATIVEPITPSDKLNISAILTE